MLNIRIGQRVPWLDRKGVRRSPLEEFRFLASETRSVLELKLAQDFTVWEIGVLVSGDGPHQSKAQIGARPGGSDLELFAVGVEHAPDHHAELSPLWCGLLKWFAGDRAERVFLSDTVWDSRTERWADLGEAMASGLITATRLSRVQGSTTPLYTAEMSGQEICSLVEQWWPSGLGMFAGIAFTDSYAGQGSRAQQPVIHPHQLSNLRHYFETSRSFDNLGIIVISRQLPWHDLTRLLSTLGWRPISGNGLTESPALPLLFRREGQD